MGSARQQVSRRIDKGEKQGGGEARTIFSHEYARAQWAFPAGNEVCPRLLGGDNFADGERAVALKFDRRCGNA